MIACVYIHTYDQHKGATKTHITVYNVARIGAFQKRRLPTDSLKTVSRSIERVPDIGPNPSYACTHLCTLVYVCTCTYTCVYIHTCSCGSFL